MGANDRGPNAAYRRRSGMVVLYLAIAMVVFLGVTALAVDFGRATAVKSQLQMIADAAALYAADNISAGTALTNAQTSVNDNPVNGTPLSLQSGDVLTGNWASGAFTAAGTPLNAVRVSLHYTKARGLGVPATFGQAVGMTAMDVNVTATATTGSAQNIGIVGLNHVSMSGGSSDSYNSSVSTTGYSSSPTYHGTIESNGNISLSGAANIQGNAMAGIGKSVSTSGGSTVSGTSGTLTTALSYPNATAGSAATTNNNSSLGTTYYSSGSGNLNISGGHTLTVPAGTYYLSNLTLSGGSILNFSGAVTIYVTGTVNLSGGSVSTAGNVPANFNLQVIGSGNVTVSGSSALYANIYCPQSDFQISGSGLLAGAVIAGAIDQSGSAAIYYDQAIGSPTSYASLVN